ncbi:TPA: MASE4 domain-containing protein [Escherichia coli]|nr:MASE4 domain-containing protein [Escherichia coli]EIG0481223.1 MASE4 domain-containing protein [Escherichia coli]HDW3209745.1 MASE4 domain-containing protein [Escherichia coli]HEB5728629.1 MASE4 domain-containing protein [Escherichia coli]
MLIIVNTFIFIEVDETTIPQSTYLIIVIALFFLDIISFMCLQIDYASNKYLYSKFILSLAFLSKFILFCRDDYNNTTTRKFFAFNANESK